MISFVKDGETFLINCFEKTFNWKEIIKSNLKVALCLIPSSFFKTKTLIIGNPLLSGANPTINKPLPVLNKKDLKAISRFVSNNKFTHDLILLKDIAAKDTAQLKDSTLAHTEPVMVLDIQSWGDYDSYIADFQSKYRKNLKRQLKKSASLTEQIIDQSNIGIHNEQLYHLFNQVAQDFKFSLCHLDKDYFKTIIEQMDNNVQIRAYFQEDKMVGFHSTIRGDRNEAIAHLIGYDKSLNSSYNIYIRLLNDIIRDAINNQYEHINFGRTASTMKSTLGAVPLEYYTAMSTPKLPSAILSKAIKLFYPFQEQEIRSPFKQK